MAKTFSEVYASKIMISAAACRLHRTVNLLSQQALITDIE